MIKFSVLFLILFSHLLFGGEINRDIKSFINNHPNVEKLNVWIFFTDKGPQADIKQFSPQQLISERAIKRRLKTGNLDIINYSDLPLNNDYVKRISEYGSNIRKKSRWLNAISAEIPLEKLDLISSLEYIKEVRLLRSFKKYKPKLESGILSEISKVATIDTSNYGFSFNQLNQINVPLLHDLGLSGAGVVIAVLDDGFNLFDTHETFESLDVIGTYDFTRDTTYVSNGGHGTNVLSAIAANSPGVLISPAYEASFLLGLTEITNFPDAMIEEDHWVAGLEWAESSGADIVSSSVGYGHYTSDPSWYTWEDMDGQTATTTLATITAETNGLIVVNSAGNEGYNDEHNTLLAPADGEFVITVGGVNSSGNRVSFSSVGPTADGRTKPDIAALGLSVWVASSNNDNGYVQASGTSFAAPLVAGSIALLLEAFPNAAPQNIREALKSTASQSSSPDNLLGWGVIDAKAAYDYLEMNTSINIERPLSNKQKSLNTPNPFSSYTTFRLPNSSRVKITLYDILGRVVLTLNENQPLLIQGNQLRARGTYFYKIEGVDIISGKKINEFGKMLYLSN